MHRNRHPVGQPARRRGRQPLREFRSGCASLRFKFDARTRYFVGSQAVNYTKFRQAAAKTDLRLDVFYEPKTRTLTRLRIPAGAATQ